MTQSEVLALFIADWCRYNYLLFIKQYTLSDKILTPAYLHKLGTSIFRSIF